jgi:spermidine synthase
VAPSFSKWQFYRSFLFPIIIEQEHSLLHPYIEVAYSGGKLVLNSATANYSFGSIEDGFRKAFNEIHLDHHDIRRVLILGYGGGTAAKLLYHYLPNPELSITGVEKDERIIHFARTYFNADELEGLRLIHDDALDFIRNDNTYYDLIIVDVSIDIYVPEEYEQEEFLELVHGRLNKDGIMLFNKVTASRTLYRQYQQLTKLANTIFKNAGSIIALGIYRVIVCFK